MPLSARHTWTAAQDRHLLKLVQQLGTRWTQISHHMQLGINYMSYRRRWETLHHQASGAWTLQEDRKLHQLVQQQTHVSWTHVASQLPGNRSPRDCYWRWAQTLTMRRGVRESPARLWGIRMDRWTEMEIHRMKNAADAVDNVEGISEGEPWLTPKDGRPRGYWKWVAGVVGTRTSHQCLMEWNKQQKTPKDSQPLLSADQVKALIKLVDQVGRKWEHLADRHFPQMTAHGLSKIHQKWTALTQQYQVNLHELDPLSILANYREGCPSALRPTGPNGMYLKGGELKLVKCYKTAEAPSMIPFWLMLKLADEHAPKRRPNKSKGERRLGDADRLIELVKELGEDWAAISKRTGWSATQCCQKYQDVVRILPSVHSTAAR